MRMTSMICGFPAFRDYGLQSGFGVRWWAAQPAGILTNFDTVAKIGSIPTSASTLWVLPPGRLQRLSIRLLSPPQLRDILAALPVEQTSPRRFSSEIQVLKYHIDDGQIQSCVSAP